MIFTVEKTHRRKHTIMGLISAALGAAAGTISDQWKEYFWCDALPSDTLVVRGQKKTKGFGNYGK